MGLSKRTGQGLSAVLVWVPDKQLAGPVAQAIMEASLAGRNDRCKRNTCLVLQGNVGARYTGETVKALSEGWITRAGPGARRAQGTHGASGGLTPS